MNVLFEINIIADMKRINNPAVKTTVGRYLMDQNPWKHKIVVVLVSMVAGVMTMTARPAVAAFGAVTNSQKISGGSSPKAGSRSPRPIRNSNGRS